MVTIFSKEKVGWILHLFHVALYKAIKIEVKFYTILKAAGNNIVSKAKSEFFEVKGICR